VVNDGTSNSNTATKDVSVTSTNDAPLILAPGSIAVLEDVATALTGISFTDVDAGSGNLTSSFNVPSGTLFATSGGGVIVSGSGTTSLTLAGSLANLNTFISGSGLSWVTAPNATSNVTLTIGINDNGNSGGSAQTASTTSTLQVTSQPDVTNVSSSTANGHYKAGDVITVTVQFDEPVNVDTTGGTPYLVLETGTTDRNANYTSGSGTSTLTFIYTVQPGDTTPDLDYVSSSSLVLNGGTIRNGATTDAVLTLANPAAAGSLGANKAIVIDTTLPVVGPIDITSGTDTGPNDDTTSNGNPIVTFTGEPGLTITLQGPDGTLLSGGQYTVNYSGGTYTVTLLDGNLNTVGNDPFGTYSNGSATGNPANALDGLYTIKATDLANNQSTVGTFTIDTTRPTLAIASSVNNLALGASAVLTITFSEVPVGFVIGDITVTSGSVSNLTPTNDPKVFTVHYTAPNVSGGSETISIANASYTDLAANNGVGTSFNQQITVIPPTLAITSDRTNLEFGQTAVLTFTFSEVPVGFTISDISVTNGTLGSLVVNPNDSKIYTVLFTPTREFIGTGTISVANGAYTNAFQVAGIGASISPALGIHTKIRGFSATGDNSQSAGSRLNNANTGTGTSVVLYDPATGNSSGNVVPFEGYQGQVRISRADTNGDNRLDMVVSAGSGFAPLVKIIDSVDGTTITQFSAYDNNFKGGLYVSVADVNNDGFAEIVTGAGAGGGPHVKVFDGRTHSEIASFFAYDSNFRGGVSVATFDFNNDGTLDIVTGAGAGGGPHVKVFDGATMGLIKEFMAYDVNFRGGVFVAAGDFLSDGRYEIITGAGAGGGPHLKIWDYQTLNLVAEKMIYDNYTYASGLVVDMLFGGGVRVGIADGNDDGILDIITGAGPGGGPHVKVLSGLELNVIRNFFSGEMDDSRGVFVGN
ncbi:MAG: Ig-like domain-containing protein, partial [Gemmataceae bacterium]